MGSAAVSHCAACGDASCRCLVLSAEPQPDVGLMAGQEKSHAAAAPLVKFSVCTERSSLAGISAEDVSGAAALHATTLHGITSLVFLVLPVQSTQAAVASVGSS